MKTITVKLKQLRIDSKLCGFRPVNAFVVSHYRHAYRAGASMPLLIVQRLKKNLYRIVSGNHRYTAMGLEYKNKNYEIEVILKDYATESDVLIDFVRDNITHGNPMNDATRRSIALELIKTRTIMEVAQLFNVSIGHLHIWGGPRYQTKVDDHGQLRTEPIKVGPVVPNGKMTAKQYETHIKNDRGISPRSMAAQLTRWLNQDWIKRSTGNIQALRELKAALDVWLKAGVKIA